MILNESLHRTLVKWQMLNKFSVKRTLHGAQMLKNKWGIEDYQKMIFLAKNYNKFSQQYGAAITYTSFMFLLHCNTSKVIRMVYIFRTGMNSTFTWAMPNKSISVLPITCNFKKLFIVIKSLAKSLIVYDPLRGFYMNEIVFWNFMLFEGPKLIYLA